MGFVHRLAVIKRCFEMDIDEHDLLGDESDWKTRFSDGNRPHVDLRAFPGGPLGRLNRNYRAYLRPRLKAAYRYVRPT